MDVSPERTLHKIEHKRDGRDVTIVLTDRYKTDLDCSKYRSLDTDGKSVKSLILEDWGFHRNVVRDNATAKVKSNGKTSQRSHLSSYSIVTSIVQNCQNLTVLKIGNFLSNMTWEQMHDSLLDVFSLPKLHDFKMTLDLEDMMVANPTTSPWKPHTRKFKKSRYYLRTTLTALRIEFEVDKRFLERLLTALDTISHFFDILNSLKPYLQHVDILEFRGHPECFIPQEYEGELSRHFHLLNLSSPKELRLEIFAADEEPLAHPLSTETARWVTKVTILNARRAQDFDEVVTAFKGMICLKKIELGLVCDFTRKKAKKFEENWLPKALAFAQQTPSLKTIMWLMELYWNPDKRSAYMQEYTIRWSFKRDKQGQVKYTKTLNFDSYGGPKNDKKSRNASSDTSDESKSDGSSPNSKDDSDEMMIDYDSDTSNETTDSDESCDDSDHEFFM